ncbi:MAG: hypothetical protein QOH16_1951 [Gaiellaceae bacterium]|jgi:hypothetical protein|nr:hypothetical protein [Gaiellaceae bacterium]
MTFAGAAVLCASWIATNAAAKRIATPVEHKAIVAAVVKAQGPHLSVEEVAVSTVDTRYVSVRWMQGTEVTVFLHRGTRGWMILWGNEPGASFDGACSFAPPAVVADLYGGRCPSWAAVHGRVATPGERTQLVEALHRSALTRGYSRSGRVTRVCMSRADSRFAAAAIDLTSTEGFVWFRRAPWRVAFETVSSRGSRPSPRVVLSLASCVGYNAAQYGG